MKKVLALLCLCIFAAGCWQKSIHPFYLETNVITNSKLPGVWLDEDIDGKDPVIYEFVTAGTNAYRLTVTDTDKKKYEFDARLFKLNENTFLDLSSRQRSLSEVPAHHLFKIGQIENKLEMRPLNTKFMQEWLAKNPNSLEHIKNLDPDNPTDLESVDYVLTANTKDLQKFVLKHMKDKEFWLDGEKLKRKN